jgi:hypothetical protein
VRITVLIAVPALALGLLTLTACGEDTEKDSPATSSTVATTPASTPTTSAAATGDYSPIADPAQEKGLDFGKLSKITTTNGVITLHIDREKFYTGDEAAAHNNGKIPLDDFIQEDEDGDGELTFTLDPKASIQVTARLSSNGEQVEQPETLTPEQLISNLDKLKLPAEPGQDDDRRPLLWLRHSDGADGPVTAIVDQFVP